MCNFQDQKGTDNKVAKLLDFLHRGNADVVDKFIYSLREAGLCEVATKYLREPKQSDCWNTEEDKEEEKETLEGNGQACQPSGEKATWCLYFASLYRRVRVRQQAAKI